MVEKEKCAACELPEGKTRENESVVTITNTTVVSRSPAETLVEKELALCDACAEIGKERVIYKCNECRSAFVSGFLKNDLVFETRDAENKPLFFSFNDNLASAMKKPVEEIHEKIVIFFIDKTKCPICTPQYGGCNGSCSRNCGGHSHGDHGCGGCKGDCGRGDCGHKHEEDES